MSAFTLTVNVARPRQWTTVLGTCTCTCMSNTVNVPSLSYYGARGGWYQVRWLDLRDHHVVLGQLTLFHGGIDELTPSAHFRIETEALCVKSQHRCEVDNRTDSCSHHTAHASTLRTSLSNPEVHRSTLILFIWDLSI